MNNTIGGANTAIGWEALTANTMGINNAALGTLPLSSNTSGNDNTAIGNLALRNNVSNSDHVAVGRLAGSEITSVDNNIIIGHHNGVHSTFGQEDNVCYIGNIWGARVDDSDPMAPALPVFVDPDGRLGTLPEAAAGNPGKSSPKEMKPQTIPDAAEQAPLNLKVQKLRDTVVQQQKQIEKLTAVLQENTAQIQKANAQLDTDTAAAKLVSNESKPSVH